MIKQDVFYLMVFTKYRYIFCTVKQFFSQFKKLQLLYILYYNFSFLLLQYYTVMHFLMKGKTEVHYRVAIEFFYNKTKFLIIIEIMTDFERAIGKAARTIYGITLKIIKSYFHFTQVNNFIYEYYGLYINH